MVKAHNGYGDDDEDWSQVPFFKSQRFLSAVLAFWGFACLYFQRVNLSIAIVCMVKHSSAGNYSHADMLMLNGTSNMTDMGYHIHHESSSQMSVSLPKLKPGDPGYCDAMELGKPKSAEDTGGDFDWDKQLQGLLHGSFYWGYLLLQVPGGMLSERYGPRRVVFWTMFPVAVLGFLSPISASLSPYLFLVVRVLIGVGEGSLYPATHALFARWSPPSEKSRLVGVSMSGGQFGNALTFPLCGLLCSTLGWESVFYVTGAIGAIWCLLWYFLVFDSPALNPRITNLERRYIQAHTTFREGQKPMPKPWKSIFTSMSFWCILVAHTCFNYGLYMMLTQIPTYMKEVLKFDLKSNGGFSMLPYLSMWAFITIAGTIADKLITKKILSKLWTRKLMSSIGTFLPAAFMIGLTFMDCTQQFPAVILLILCVGFSGFGFAGFLVNHGDIAPQFAGTLFGVTNISATIPGILAPYIVGVITPNKTREEWQMAFFICAAIYVFGGIFYLIFAQTSVEKWAQQTPVSQEIEPGESRRMVNLQENKV